MSSKCERMKWSVLGMLAAGAAAAIPALGKDVMLMNRIGPSKMELYIANADGSGERRLLPDSNALDYDPSFSPDGQWIVFTSERDGAGSGQADIWRVHPDGTGLERLTNDTSMEDAGVLSPDGKKLAYVSTKGGARTANIWVMDLTTHRAKNLTGDGKSDLLWHKASLNQFAYWVMNGGTPVSYSSITTLTSGYQLVATGDFLFGDDRTRH